jgi:hypothetical protein
MSLQTNPFLLALWQTFANCRKNILPCPLNASKFGISMPELGLEVVILLYNGKSCKSNLLKMRVSIT